MLALTNRDDIASIFGDATDLRWVQVGSQQDNVGVTTFQVRRSTTDPIGYALLVEVQNFSEQDANMRLKLELNSDLVDVVPIKLEPGGTWRSTIDGTSQAGGVLKGSIDADDGLSADNVARAIVPKRNLVPVTLVSDAESDCFYLRNVLNSIPLVRLTDAPDGWDPLSAPVNSLTVFSGVTPKAIPKGPVLFVNTTEDGPAVEFEGKQNAAWKIGKSIESPIIAKQNKESPLLRHVQLQNVILAGGRDVEVTEQLGQATTLLETAEASRVLVSVERASGRILILAADLDSSDLPLRIAFPVMMTNAINWFFRETGEMNPALATGQVTNIPWDFAASETADDTKIRQAVLVDPEGTSRQVTVRKEQAAVGPMAKAGVYGLFEASSLPESNEETEQPSTPESLLTGTTKGILVAVNLCDANESDLRLPEFDLSQQGSPPPRGASAWFYLVLLALGIVVSEWVLFNRRVVA